MQFKPSKMMKINVLLEQENQLSTKEKIKVACTYEDVLAFDIYSNDLLVGFVEIDIVDEDGIHEVNMIYYC